MSEKKAYPLRINAEVLAAAQGQAFDQLDLPAQEALWQAVKAQE